MDPGLELSSQAHLGPGAGLYVELEAGTFSGHPQGLTSTGG